MLNCWQTRILALPSCAILDFLRIQFLAHPNASSFTALAHPSARPLRQSHIQALADSIAGSFKSLHMQVLPYRGVCIFKSWRIRVLAHQFLSIVVCTFSVCTFKYLHIHMLACSSVCTSDCWKAHALAHPRACTSDCWNTKSWHIQVLVGHPKLHIQVLVRPSLPNACTVKCLHMEMLAVSSASTLNCLQDQVLSSRALQFHQLPHSRASTADCCCIRVFAQSRAYMFKCSHMQVMAHSHGCSSKCRKSKCLHIRATAYSSASAGASKRLLMNVPAHLSACTRESLVAHSVFAQSSGCMQLEALAHPGHSAASASLHTQVRAQSIACTFKCVHIQLLANARQIPTLHIQVIAHSSGDWPKCWHMQMHADQRARAFKC